MIDRVRSALRLAKDGEWRDIGEVVRHHWHSNSSSVGLRRDVTIPFPAPPAAIPITVRQLAERDIPILFEQTGQELTGEAKRQRATRLRLVRLRLPTCYVAVTADDQPCYVQWLIGAESNDAVQRLFVNRFPVLAPDDMLLEGAFTLEAWRGKGIMAAAMAQIAEKALDHHARYVVTLVATDNIPSLKGCKKAGFEPYVARTDSWRRFRFTASFGPLSAAPAFA
jgi:GNAT superfamily N-acetyltransferase